MDRTDLDTERGALSLDTSGESDTEPARDSRASDPVAALYNEYAGQMSANLRRTYGDGPPDPNDAVHQAFEKLLERGDHASIRNLKAFVWRTARNIILYNRRSSAARRKYDFDVEQLFFPLKHDVSTPESILIARDQLAEVNRVLARMPRKRRMAVILHSVEGLSVAEAARRLGISRSTAAQHVVRGLADLDMAVLKVSEGKPR